MTRISPYNFEQYSILDMKKYIEGLGYETSYVSFDDTNPSLVIIGTTVSIDFPYNEEMVAFMEGDVYMMPCIRYRDNLYSLCGIKPNEKQLEQLAKDEKLYKSLMRKFRLGNKQTNKQIKDWVTLKPFVQKHSRKVSWIRLHWLLIRCFLGAKGFFRHEARQRGLNI